MIYNPLFRNKGQMLIEVLVASVIIIIVVMSAALAMSSALMSQKKTKNAEVAGELLVQAQEAVKIMAQQNWPYYISTTTSGLHYKVSTTTAGWQISLGDEIITINGVNFTRYVVLDDIRRMVADDAIVASCGDPKDTNCPFDPSTKKLTTYVYWKNGPMLSAVEYITRYHNESWIDTDWSGGPAATTTLVFPGNIFASSNNINYSSTTGSMYLLSYSTSGLLMSQIYDLGVNSASGVVLNSVVWRGASCSGCKVWFQMASSNSTSGPWGDDNFLGYDGTLATWYGGADFPDSQIKIRRLDCNNKRYFRYKTKMEPSTDFTQTPIIIDIILNWSK